MLANNGEDSRLRDGKPLEWEPHLLFLLIFILISIIVTIFYFTLPVVLQSNKMQFMLRYGLLAFIQFFTTIILLPASDIFFDGVNISFKELLVKRCQDLNLTSKNGSWTEITRDTLLLLLLAVVPLDLITYLIPGVVDFVSNSIVGQYFNNFSLAMFLIISPVYNLITGLKEEFFFRGFMTSLLKEKGRRDSAWIIVSLVFGMLHFNIASFYTFPLGPITWFLSALVIGMIFGAYVLFTRRLLVVILAHSFGNFISSTTIWMYYQTSGFNTLSFFNFISLFYLPMLIAGGIIAISSRNHIKNGATAFKTLLSETKNHASLGDLIIAIVIIISVFLSSAFFFI
ncbi:MAG: CPBP family intramembrane glutamic endopeptidase [Promethearchaeota archaeon]